MNSDRNSKSKGFYKSRIPNQELRVAAKHLADAAGLIECHDPNWRIAAQSASGRGICKKYNVGRNHPLYDEFIRFAATICADKLGAGIAAKK
jgi:hypothetical protein